MSTSGLLQYSKALYASEPDAPAWNLELKIDDMVLSARTDSRIVLAVLETSVVAHALQGQKHQWPAEITLHSPSTFVERVRVQDERVDVCKRVESEAGNPFEATPLSPTAFADEDPVKWGFFFYFPATRSCQEFKGTSLDQYAIAESIWMRGAVAKVYLDENGYIKDIARAAE